MLAIEQSPGDRARHCLSCAIAPVLICANSVRETEIASPFPELAVGAPLDCPRYRVSMSPMIQTLRLALVTATFLQNQPGQTKQRLAQEREDGFAGEPQSPLVGIETYTASRPATRCGEPLRRLHVIKYTSQS